MTLMLSSADNTKELVALFTSRVYMLGGLLVLQVSDLNGEQRAAR
jgi:hypothetical protein